MFLVNERGITQTPNRSVIVSVMTDPTIINPEIRKDNFKLVAPNSQLYIIDRNTMRVVKRIALNYNGDFTPYDIYPDIVGKRYIGFIYQRHTKKAFVVNAFENDELTIYYFDQRWTINRDVFKVNDCVLESKDRKELITITQFTNLFQESKCSLSYSVCGGPIYDSIEDSGEFFDLVTKSINNFGTMKFIGHNRFIYSTRNLNDRRYLFELDKNITINKIHDRLTIMKSTLNTIDEIERLDKLMSCCSKLCFSNLAGALLSMGMPNLATASLLTNLHYARDIKNLNLDVNDVVKRNLKVDNVLGRYLSNTQLRKALRLLRKMRVNHLEELTNESRN